MIFSASMVRQTYQNAPKHEDAFDYADFYSDEDGDPRTVWGMKQGITRLSQELQYADERVQR
jgi:hypothetical protein